MSWVLLLLAIGQEGEAKMERGLFLTPLNPKNQSVCFFIPIPFGPFGETNNKLVVEPPIWKICSSSWIISPIFGVKHKKIFELPPPSFNIHWITSKTPISTFVKLYSRIPGGPFGETTNQKKYLRSSTKMVVACGWILLDISWLQNFSTLYQWEKKTNEIRASLSYSNFQAPPPRSQCLPWRPSASVGPEARTLGENPPRRTGWEGGRDEEV